METATDKYLISRTGCRIVCHYRQEPQVRITTVGQQGIQVEEKPFGEVFHAPALPFFTATYLPRDKEFDVDADCGAQRWRGPQSVAAVRKALGRCGVERETARKVVAEAVKAARSG
jgi:hypothetical protein